MCEKNRNNNRNRIRCLDDKDVIRADVAKLHNEVNQLRNHEFLINSFAIATVAVSLSVVTEYNFIIVFIMLFLLLIIRYWQYTILDLRTRITTYLSTFKYSYWEHDYRSFSDRRPNPSMSHANIFLFIIIGILFSMACYNKPGRDSIFSILSDGKLLAINIGYSILNLYFGNIYNFFNGFLNCEFINAIKIFKSQDCIRYEYIELWQELRMTYHKDRNENRINCLLKISILLSSCAIALLCFVIYNNCK